MSMLKTKHSVVITEAAAITVSVFLMLLSISSCKSSGRNNRGDKQTIAQTDSISLSSLVTIDCPLDSVYYSGPYEIGRYFGWEELQGDEGKIPDIPGLIYLETSGCHLAVRCPADRKIQKWVSSRVKLFADWCINGPADTIPSIVPQYPVSDSMENLCNKYISYIKGAKGISPQRDTAVIVEQFADLLVDIYDGENYCTMQEVKWYDHGSCGDNTSRSWFSIDKKSGRELGFNDIIDASKSREFAYLMVKHLNAYGLPWFDYNRELRDCDLLNLLAGMDGIAIIPEGVIVYYHPYAIGSGAEGQYNALIPINELKGMIRAELSN